MKDIVRVSNRRVLSLKSNEQIGDRKGAAKVLERRISEIHGLIRVAKLPVMQKEQSVHFMELSDATVLLIGKGNGGGIHSVYRPYSVITNGCWDIMGCLPALVPTQGVIGIYGVGAGTVPRIIHEFFPAQKMRGWELDPDIIDLARTHMDLTNLEKSKSLEVFIGDCISESAVVSGGFTGLVVDIYLDDKTHPSLSEVEIWRSLRSRLKAGGRIMANLEPEHLPLLHEVFSGDLQWHMHQPSGNLLALTGPYPTDEKWSGIPSALANLGVTKNWHRGQFDKLK